MHLKAQKRGATERAITTVIIQLLAKLIIRVFLRCECETEVATATLEII